MSQPRQPPSLGSSYDRADVPRGNSNSQGIRRSNSTDLRNQHRRASPRTTQRSGLEPDASSGSRDPRSPLSYSPSQGQPYQPRNPVPNGVAPGSEVDRGRSPRNGRQIQPWPRAENQRERLRRPSLTNQTPEERKLEQLARHIAAVEVAHLVSPSSGASQALVAPACVP